MFVKSKIKIKINNYDACKKMSIVIMLLRIQLKQNFNGSQRNLNGKWWGEKGWTCTKKTWLPQNFITEMRAPLLMRMLTLLVPNKQKKKQTNKKNIATISIPIWNWKNNIFKLLKEKIESEMKINSLSVFISVSIPSYDKSASALKRCVITCEFDSIGWEEKSIQHFKFGLWSYHWQYIK